jgi:hypothetical protein
MNDYTTSNAAPANTNSGEDSVATRHGSAMRYENLQVYGRTQIGLCALVNPNDCIVVYGVNHNHIRGSQLIGVTFRVGDPCTYGGRNIDYVGTITSIGEKLITVRNGGMVKRLPIGTFAQLNKDFDLAKVEARNAAWLD